MKIIPLQTPGQTPITNDPRPLEGLRYVLELTGAELYAFRAVARNIGGDPVATVRRYTDELATTEIPGLPPASEIHRCPWYSGSLGANALSEFKAAPAPASPEAEDGTPFRAGESVRIIGPSIGARTEHIGEVSTVSGYNRSPEACILARGGIYRVEALEKVVWWNPQHTPEPGAGFRFLTKTEWLVLSATGYHSGVESVKEYWSPDGEDWATRCTLGCRLTTADTYRVPVRWKLQAEAKAEPVPVPAPSPFNVGDVVRIIGSSTGYRENDIGIVSKVANVVRRSGEPVSYRLEEGGRYYAESLEKTKPAPSPLAPGFNPNGLSVGEVDPEGEGWRLLSLAEVTACTKPGDPYTDPEGFDFPGFPDTQYLSDSPKRWSETAEWHAYDTEEGVHGTLRTRRPKGYYLTRRSGVHNPAKITPEQVGDGWRLLTVEEAASPGQYHQGSQYWTCANEWSPTGDWRAYNSETGTLRVRE